MAIDKNMLIKLYSIALEEARHHDQLYTQTWTPVILATSVVGTLGLIIWRYFLTPEALFSFKLFMTLLGILLGYFFIWSASRHTAEGDICRDIANKIEGILMGKTNEETLKIGDLLVVQKIKAVRGSWYKQVYSPIIKHPRLLAYLLIALGAWIYLWWGVVGIYIK